MTTSMTPWEQFCFNVLPHECAGSENVPRHGKPAEQVFRSPRREDKKHQRPSPKREPVDMGKHPAENFQANQSGSR